MRIGRREFIKQIGLASAALSPLAYWVKFLIHPWQVLAQEAAWHAQKSLANDGPSFITWIQAVRGSLQTYANKQQQEGNRTVSQTARDTSDRLESVEARVRQRGAALTVDDLEAAKRDADTILRPHQIPTILAAIWGDFAELYRKLLELILKALRGDLKEVPFGAINAIFDTFIRSAERIGDPEAAGKLRDLKALKEKVEKGLEVKEKLEEAIEKLLDLKPRRPEQKQERQQQGPGEPGPGR